MSWPTPPRDEAFHGLAGRIVRTIEPHTEADPVALLAQTLVAFGSMIGRGPHFRVEADRHFTNLFAVLVGETSKARKGTSWGHVARLMEDADEGWPGRVESGLSSGEGLIWQVRDPFLDANEPIVDKRLLVFEPEFANVLRVLERSGNRLSSVVRDAWDGRRLRTMTKNTSATATDAHIAIVGHITEDELRRYLDRTEVANGFGNRFLFLSVRRSKVLPEGGLMHRENVAALVDELREAARHAATVATVSRDANARRLWADVYPTLSEGLPGLVGALTGRAEAQTMRLALAYALLDQSTTIRVEHLQAALALWDYSLRSVQHVFGNSLGDPIADTILSALHANPNGDGLTRTQIRAAVGNRVEAAAIDRALALIARHGLAHMTRDETTGGRPAEHWKHGRQPT